MTQTIKQYDFTLEEVQKLFQMQDTLNSYIHPEWKTQGFDWHTAIIDECQEIKEHLGWKWWKKGYQVGLTKENLGQIQLEVIDILHFVVSIWDERDLQRYFLENINYRYKAIFGVLADVTDMRRHAANELHDYYMEDWACLAHSVGLTKSQILETYTQKYVLNKFRQDHGYKDGSYQKEWKLKQDASWRSPEESKQWGITLVNGEDNYWLEQVVTNLRNGGHDTTDENMLYSELSQLYNRRINQ